MSLREEDVEKETRRRQDAEKELKKNIIKFLQESLLRGEPYRTKREIEDNFKKAGFQIENNGIPSGEGWLNAFLRKTFSIKIVYHKGKQYYKYKYKRWAKVCSMSRKS